MDYIILKGYPEVQGREVNSSFRTKMASRDQLGIESVPSLEVANFDKLDEVEDARRDPIVRAIAPSMPITLIKPFESPSNNLDKDDGWGISAVGAEKCKLSGAGVRIAVLDTGINRDHPAFEKTFPIEKDFTGAGDGDVVGHGTHCAGVIFGRDVEHRRIGIARGVTQPMILKVLNNSGIGQTKNLFDAMFWAAMNGANIISLSLGFDFATTVKNSMDSGLPAELAASQGLQAYGENLRLFDSLMTTIRTMKIFGGGALVIAATGNESRVDEDPRFRIGPSLPAAAEGVISVGALQKMGANSLLEVAPFSNSLPTLVAPGVNIVSANHQKGLKSLSGTSMACPHVAGVAALWWQWAREERPGEDTAKVVTTKLLETSTLDQFKPGISASIRGAGLVQAPN